MTIQEEAEKISNVVRFYNNEYKGRAEIWLPEIERRLGFKTRPQAIKYAVEKGLIFVTNNGYC